MMPCYLKRLTETARMPTRATAGAAGFELYADEPMLVPARNRAVIRTGLAVALDSCMVGVIWPLWDLAAKNGIESGAGVIGADCRSEVRVLLHNHSDQPFQVSVGDRIAQLLIQHVASPGIVEMDELPAYGGDWTARKYNRPEIEE